MGGRVRARPEQARDGEGGAGGAVFAVGAQAGEGGGGVEPDAVPVRVRHDGRGYQLPATTADLPGGGAVPVGEESECERSELVNGARNPEMGRQRSYTTGAINTRNHRIGSNDLGRGQRGERR